MRTVTLIAVAAGLLSGGCVSYSRNVVEKPVPASTVVYTDATPVPATTTTVYVPR